MYRKYTLIRCNTAINQNKEKPTPTWPFNCVDLKRKQNLNTSLPEDFQLMENETPSSPFGNPFENWPPFGRQLTGL